MTACLYGLVLMRSNSRTTRSKLWMHDGEDWAKSPDGAEQVEKSAILSHGATQGDYCSRTLKEIRALRQVWCWQHLKLHIGGQH